MRRGAAAICTLGTSIAIWALATPAGAQGGDPTAAGLAYRVAGMDDVTVQRNVVYKRGATYARLPRGVDVPAPRDLAFDVYRPPSGMPNVAGGRRPAVLFAHGGVQPARAPSPKDWRAFGDWGRLAAASGMVGIPFNHRATPFGNVDEAASDVRDAVAFVRAHADALGVDPDRVCVAFFSAGGPAAGGLLGGPAPPVRCLAFFYAYLDLEHVTPPARRDSLAAYSPRAALAADPNRMPPLFVAAAGRDAVPGLNASVARFAAAAAAAGAALELHVLRGGRHGFDVGPGDARAAAIVRAAVGFLRRNLDVAAVPD